MFSVDLNSKETSIYESFFKDFSSFIFKGNYVLIE